MGFYFEKEFVKLMSIFSWMLRVSLWALLALMSMLLLWSNPQWLNQLNWLTQDKMVRYAASEASVDSVVLIDIDEASLQLLSAWPWPRSLSAQLIEKLVAAQVKVIGIDIVFPEPTNRSDDEQLQDALKKHQAILPIIWDYRTQEPSLAVGALPKQHGIFLASDACYAARGYVTSFAEMNASAWSLGHISPVPDQQGIMRFMPPVVCWQGKAYPMLALSMFFRYIDQPINWTITDRAILFSQDHHVRQILLDEQLWRIPYRYDISSFTSMPAWQILADQVDIDLSGKAVIIGSSAVGLNDRVATPLMPIAPGMLLHAQMFADLLSNKGYYYQYIEYFYALLVFVFVIMLAFIILRYSIGVAIIWWLMLMLMQISVALLAYLFTGALVSLATGMLLLSSLFITQSIMEWSLVKRQSHHIYQIFKDYLPDTVLAQLLKNNEANFLVPQQKEVTVLFADLVDFTRMTETMPTAEAAALTRQVLSLLTEAIHQSHGTLDKYMGDAVMAFWNAPLNQANHRFLAIESALAMRASMTKLNEQRKTEGKASLAIHVGINTGEALVGDLGTEWRHAYTVLGDAINVAQRLMMLAHSLTTDIVIGRATASCCQEKLLSTGHHKLSGRTQLEEVFVIPITHKV